MADSYSIKDLPDFSRMEDGKLYMVSGEWMKTVNSILGQLHRGENVSRGNGVKIRQGGQGGFTISVNNGPSISAGTSYTPFQIFTKPHFVSGVADGSTDVTLYPGSINQFLPTNIFSTINATISSTQYVVLTITSSTGNEISSSSWSLMSSPPTPPDATPDAPPVSTNFYAILGIIGYNSGTLTTYQLVNDNLTALPVVWTTTNRTGAGPFEMASVNYYHWKVS
jgi:hypothetical protein